MNQEQRRRLIIKLQTLISKQGADKEVVYASFGVASSKQMTDAQLITCVEALEGKTPHNHKAAEADAVTRKLRSDILAVITKSPNAKTIKSRGLGVPNDWTALNPFIRKRTGNQLNKLTIAEMEALKKQLYKMRDKGWSWRDHSEEHQAPPRDLNRRPNFEIQDDLQESQQDKQRYETLHREQEEAYLAKMKADLESPLLFTPPLGGLPS